MNMRRFMAAVGLLAVALVGMVPAAASAEPQVVDGCGTDGLAADPAEGITTPWTDICTGVFETLPGGSGLKVTATYAGDIPDDRIGVYAAQWRIGDCTYRISHEVGAGEYGSNGVVISDPGGDWLRVRCGSSTTETCNVAATCVTWPGERHYPLTEAATIAGDTVTLTVRFTGDLAEVGDRHAAGTRLTNLRVESSSKAGIWALYPGFCYGTTCGSVGGDIGYGQGYTVGG